jgi:beta-lactamase superfamily II metal-dependent hydrolase
VPHCPHNVLGRRLLAHLIGRCPPPSGELYFETNDNSVAFLLSCGTARVLLAGDAEAREEEYVANGPK